MTAKLDLDIRETGDGQKVLYFPFISMSDIHLGTDACRARRLCQWLESTRSDTLMLPGDIVDGEALAEKEHWQFGNEWHRQGIAHFLRKADFGTRVVYAIGNHESGVRESTIVSDGKTLPHRQLTGKTIFGVDFVERTEHVDPRGRRMLIVHGDKYDDHIFKDFHDRQKWYRRGDKAYSALNAIDNKLHKIPMLEEFSIASYGKKLAKTVINKFMGINRAIGHTVDVSPDYQGVIYGHSHMGGFMKSPGGKILMNDGCSTEHVQALVHDRAGNWAVLTVRKAGLHVTMEDNSEYFMTWKSLGLEQQFKDNPPIRNDEYTRRTDRLLRLIYRMWPPKDRAATREAIREREHLAASFLQAANREIAEHREKLINVPVRKPAPEDA